MKRYLIDRLLEEHTRRLALQKRVYEASAGPDDTSRVAELMHTIDVQRKRIADLEGQLDK